VPYGSRPRFGDTARRRARRAAVWRRRLVVLVAVALIIAAVVAVTGRAREPLDPAPPPAHLVLRAGARAVLDVAVSRYVVAGRVRRERLAALIEAALPARALVETSRLRIAYRYDSQATVDRAAALGARGGRVDAVRRPVASRVAVPVVAQALRNNCEAAALEILLASAGRRVDQLRIQRAFPTSGAVDPRGVGDGRVWGDPEQGYVGRPDGGGAAGGFGIYPAPVRATAARLGARLDDLSGAQPARVYARLLSGRAVMAWVGLSDGPYGSWRSPSGRRVRVNFGEHTVVLYGMRSDGAIEVSNPLEGTREVWSREKFETMWQLLGRRALAT
jgi:uncharacterized protein YvpB